jgi:hypothetical protein
VRYNRQQERTERRKNENLLSLDFYTVDSAQPRRLNNTTEGVENPTQSWDNNAAV